MLQHRRDFLKIAAAFPVVGSALALIPKPLPPLRLRYSFQSNTYVHAIYSRYPATDPTKELHDLKSRPMFAQIRPPGPALCTYKWEINHGWLTYLGWNKKCLVSRTELRYVVRTGYIVRTAGVIHLFYSQEDIPKLPMQSCIIDALGVLHTPSYVANTPPNGTIHIWNAFMQGDECFAKLSPPLIYNPELAKSYWDQTVMTI